MRSARQLNPDLAFPSEVDPDVDILFQSMDYRDSFRRRLPNLDHSYALAKTLISCGCVPDTVVTVIEGAGWIYFYPRDAVELQNPAFITYGNRILDLYLMRLSGSHPTSPGEYRVEARSGIETIDPKWLSFMPLAESLLIDAAARVPLIMTDPGGEEACRHWSRRWTFNLSREKLICCP